LRQSGRWDQAQKDDEACATLEKCQAHWFLLGDAQRTETKEARAGDSTRKHGRADYEKRADRKAKPELSSIVVASMARRN
jgi:hypothetical protein